ncbi:MAG TPA: hypothetical protein V6D47_20585 [Oscillatoriaceae cyanobacterium]
MREPILGVTRRGDEPKSAVTGVIHREGEKLKWSAVDALPSLYRLGSHSLPLERVEFTVNGAARFLFRLPDGKLAQEELKDKLLFSEKAKALLKSQQLPKPLPYGSLALEYLEVCRLSDAMRKEMLGGERSVGQLAETLGVPASDAALVEALWELSRKGLVTLHELGSPAENAIALNRPLASLK